MNNLLKEIEEYFQNTSKDQIQKDWDALKEYNNVRPSVAEYLSSLCSKVWMYNGTRYGAFKVDWNEFGKTQNYDLLVNPIIVYNSDWDKCYYLEILEYHGHGNKLKAYIRDVYDVSKRYWVEARKLEIVRKLN